MKKFLNEFKEFISKGNVFDMAIGVIVGGMFSKIVNSLTNDIFMPFISLLTGKTNFENMFIALDGNDYTTLADAIEAQAAVVAYGNLIKLVIDFVITAFFLFLIVKGINNLRKIKVKKEDNADNE